jgi:hypothetical protein
VRSTTKASSAGSSTHRADGRGRVVRGAGATRALSHGADGSGAPSHRGRLAALSLAAALLALALLASSAFASKELLSDFGTFAGSASFGGGSGSFGGELNNPRDIGVNESGVGPANAGDTYVADEANNRIERFAADGSFISAWGKDVIAASINERQRIVVSATAGTYTLSFNGSTTAPVPYDTSSEGDIRGRLAELPTVGGFANVEVSGGGTSANPFIVTFKGTLGGADQSQLSADTSESSGPISISTIANGTSTVANDTGAGFEICTVATECKAGVASGGGASASGNGSLSAPQSVAVDPDTGNVYASDRGNRRIDEYDGEGHFIRSFGFDVAESGPGNTGTGYEACNQGEGDVCKAGVGGAGVGQYGTGFTQGFGIAVSPADANAATGTVYLADSGNRRVDTFNLDGTSPASFGSSANFGAEQPRSIAVDSRGIVYASDSNNNGDVLRYDSQNANGGGVGFLAPILPPNDEQQKIAFTGFNAGDHFRLTCPNGTPTEELTYSAGSIGLTVIQNGLEAACGAGNFSFSGTPPNATVTLEGSLAGANQPQMTCTVLSGSGSCAVSTTSEGRPGPLLPGLTGGLAVNPAGTVLYVLRSSGKVQQFGPTNAPGLTAAPTATDDTHGAAGGFSGVTGLGFNSASGRLYVSATGDPDGSEGPLLAAHRVYVLADSSALPSPTASMPPVGAVTDIATRSATFNGEVDPKGGLISCKFQSSTDEVNWTDAETAEGTGDFVDGSTTITNVKTTSGAFVAGQVVNGPHFLQGSKTKIVAIHGDALTLSNYTYNGDEVGAAFSAGPQVPPACDALNPNGGAQSVSQSVSGLAPDAHYFVRLQVTRPYFSGFTPVTSAVRSFTTASGPPVIAEASARAVDEHSVRISAMIDPSHSATTYVVQYGTTPALGSSTAPVSVGGGTQPIDVSPVIGGLSPATQYYFKIVATNLVGSTPSEGLAVVTFASPPSFGPCPNDLLRTGPSAKLPDCRAYEQVTPTDKFGSDAFGSLYSVEASSAGDGITSFSLAGFPGGEGFQEANVLQSRFTGGKWSTSGLNTPPSYGDEANVLAWTPDLRLSFTAAASSEDGFGGASLVMRDSADGARTVLIPLGAEYRGFTLGGAFGGDSKVVFGAEGSVPVTSGPVSGQEEGDVYLYDRVTGELTLAGLLPNSACGSPPCVPAEGSKLPAAFGLYVQDGHVVSPSGDVYFIDRETDQLYLRRDAAAGPGASTVPVSASERTDCADHDPCNGTPEPDPAGTFASTFMGATPDGSHAFFKSRQKLTDNSAATAGAEDLYRFDAGAPEGQRLADLVPGAKLVGVLGYSDDGSHVYFAANADLDAAGQAASGDCAGTAGGTFSGSCSVYLWQAEGAGTCATAGGCVSFVARIDADDDGFDWAGAGREIKSSRVSADGRSLVFRSRRQLTAYDNHGPHCVENGLYLVAGSCPEFYRYDAESGQLSCLTCDPTGAPPAGTPDLKNPDMFHAPASHSGYEAQPFLSRNLSPDGNRFFFQSTDKLVPADVNGEASCPSSYKGMVRLGAGPSCRDVYEWEAPGTPGGSCTINSNAHSSANGGCIYLLSTGTGPYPSYLADVSDSGDTAFIFSRQQLVPSDEDTQEDIYAVKVDGGLAAQHETRRAPCEGDACRGASSQPSDAPGAGTAVFEGPGNPKSGTNKTRCPKGKRTVHVKGKVRCVAKHAKHKKRHHKRAANNDRRASR